MPILRSLGNDCYDSYMHIRNSVLDNLRANGKFPAAAEIGPGTQMPLVEYAALTDAYKEYLGSDIPRRNCGGLPGRDIRWRDAGNTMLTFEREHVAELLELMRSASDAFAARSVISAPPDAAEPPCAENPTAQHEPSETDDARRQAQIILEEAERQAEELKNAALLERMCAEEDAKKLRRDAEAYSNDIRRKADEDVAERRRRAMAVAASIEQDSRLTAEKERERILLEARIKAEDERREILSRRAEAELHALTEAHLKEYFRQQQKQAEDLRTSAKSTLEDMVCSRNQVTSELASLLSASGNELRSISEDISAALSLASEQFGNIRSQLNQALENHQRSYYNAGFYKGIADCYVNINIYITALTNRLMSETLGADEAQHAAMVKELGDILRNVTVFRDQLEQAMLRNGMHLISPAEGDVYEERYHCDSEQTKPAGSSAGYTVKKCIAPGVRWTTGTYDHVYTRAVVTLSAPEVG